MLKRVKEYVHKWHMLQKEDCVIVGVSGGADSVCLLFVLLELKKEIGFDIVAVHVNHGLRGKDSDEDEAFVKKLCAENGIMCECYFENVELIAKKRKQCTEEAGREIRRAFFQEAFQKHGGTKIALAHHKNDSAETFLFHLARGTGLRGLGGIAPVKDNVIRPLLCLERKEIEAYLQSKGIAYCTDQSNKSDMYTRNRIRNYVIPYMEEQVNEKMISHMGDTMEQIRQIEAYLEKQVEGYWQECVCKCHAGYVILEQRYREVPEALKSLLIRKVLATACGREKDLEAIHFGQVQELFEKQTGRKVDLPYGLEAKRSYEGVEIYLKEDEKLSSHQIFGCVQGEEGEAFWNGRRIKYRLLDRTEQIQDSFENSSMKWFDYDIIESNICFRTREQGDYITIHTDGRTQKLKSYFINEKIPQRERDKLLLVADGNHILWIVGHRTNPLYQINENTKRILEIQIDEGESYGRDN